MALQALRAIDFEGARKQMIGWLVGTPKGEGSITGFEIVDATPLSGPIYLVWVKVKGEIHKIRPEDVQKLW